MTGHRPTRPDDGDQAEVLEPTAIHPPGFTPTARPASAGGGTSPASAAPDRRDPAAAAGANAAGAPPAAVRSGAQRAPAPAPRLISVGDIPGLSPRRRRGPGRSVGEVAAASVDLVDRLPRPPQGQEWPTVAAWLQSRNTVTTRRGYLHCLVAFLRWMELSAPGVRLLQVTEDDLAAYKDQISSGTGAAAHLLKGGRPLGAHTVAQRISALRSLYAYALRRHVIDSDPSLFVDPPKTPRIGMTPALSLQDALALLDGAEAIATEHPQDAAAVALLLHTGLRTGELEAMPVSAFKWDSGHYVARFRVKGGKILPVPIIDRVRVLVEPLSRGRPGREYLIQDADGRPWDRNRVTTALRRAARSAGLPGDTVAGLTPHVLRATAVTLLRAAGWSPDLIGQLTGQTIETVLRYDRSEIDLDQHIAYRLGKILSDDSEPRT